MDLMTLLYRIMEEMSLAGVPIIFKGAMVLNLVLHEKNPTGIVRATRDIDGDWYGKHPSMEQIEACLKEAVKRVAPELGVYAVREFGEKRSAGFRISNEKGEKVASIDLSIRNNVYTQHYYSYVGGIQITGASLEKMMADKLYAISEDKVLRRIKDILDIYVMSFVGSFGTVKIQEIWKNTDRKPGDFSFLKENTGIIGEAYNKLLGIENKPDFIDLYSRVIQFVEPFSRSIIPQISWSASGWDERIAKQEKTR